MKNGRTAFTIVCNKKLNFWLSLFCSRGKDIVAKDTIWRGISSFTFVPIDRIGLKGAHVYQNPFITVSVKGTDKTFRSLDNWLLQTCVESANMVSMRKASTSCNSLPSCQNYFRFLTRNEYAICRSLRQTEINLLCKLERQWFLEFPVMDQITVMLYFLAQRDWGRGRVVEMSQLKRKTIVSCF